MSYRKFQLVPVKHFQSRRFLARDWIHFVQIALPVAALHKDRLRRNRGIKHRKPGLKHPSLVLLSFLLGLRVYEEHRDHPSARCLAYLALHDHARIGVRSWHQRPKESSLQRHGEVVAHEFFAPPDQCLGTSLGINLFFTLHAPVSSPIGADQDSLGVRLHYEAQSD